MLRLSEADVQSIRKKQIVKLEIRHLKEIIGIEELCVRISDFYLLPDNYRDSTFKSALAQNPSFSINRALLFYRQDDRRLLQRRDFFERQFLRFYRP